MKQRYSTLLLYLLFVSLLSHSASGQRMVAQIPLKNVTKSFHSFSIGDSVLIVSRYENSVRKKQAPSGTLESGAIVGIDGTIRFIEIPDEICDRIIGVTRRSDGLNLHVLLGDRAPFTLHTFKLKAPSDYKLSLISKESIPSDIYGSFTDNSDLFLVTIEREANEIQLWHFQDGKFITMKSYRLPEDFPRIREEAYSLIWEGEPVKPAQMGPQGRIYISRNRLVAVYDRVTNRKNNFTLIFDQDSESGIKRSYKIDNNTGFHFRTTWHDEKLYSVSRHSEGFYVSIYDGDILQHSFSVTDKSEISDKPAFPKKSSIVKTVIRTPGPPFAIISSVRDRLTLQIGAHVVEKNTGGVLLLNPPILAIASGIFHSLSEDIYVNPSYFYMHGSVGNGFEYVLEPEVASHKIMKYERTLYRRYLKIEHLPSSRGMMGVYLTTKPYGVEILSF